MKKRPTIFQMYSYLSFVEYLRKKNLILAWNDETEQYDIFECGVTSDYRAFKTLLTTITEKVVRRKYDEAVEEVETALELNRLFS